MQQRLAREVDELLRESLLPGIVRGTVSFTANTAAVDVWVRWTTRGGELTMLARASMPFDEHLEEILQLKVQSIVGMIRGTYTC